MTQDVRVPSTGRDTFIANPEKCTSQNWVPSKSKNEMKTDSDTCDWC